jgi:hypothetical protein
LDSGTVLGCKVRAVGISPMEPEWVASIVANTATDGFKPWATGTVVAGYNQSAAGSHVVIRIVTTVVGSFPERQWKFWVVHDLTQSFLLAFAFCVWLAGLHL